METGNDPRLKRLLREWQVSDAPDALEKHVFGRARPWWRILIGAQIRIPVPVAIAAAVTMIWLAVVVARDRPPASERSSTTLSLRGFQPVNYINVRIERSSYAAQ